MIATAAFASTPAFAVLEVVEVRRDTQDSVVVRFDPRDDARFRFVHGQHLTLRRYFDGVEVRRSYSICSPAPNGSLQVAIKLVTGGAFSTWANENLAVGDHIDVMTPTGHFTHKLDPSAARSYALVAAGSGITPVLSVAATVLESEPRSHLSLVVVNRTSGSIMLLDDVESLRNRFLGRVQIWHVLTREHTTVPLLSGRPDRDRFRAFIDAGILPARPDEVFVCGPADIVARVRDVYEWVEQAHVHDELFTVGQVGRAQTAGPRAVDDTDPPVGSGAAILHGRVSAFAVYGGDSVLDATSRARPDAPFSCRSGICSTCRAKLLEGEVTMAVTHGLVSGDQEAGYILSCQALPTTTHVRVDFDA